MSIIDPILPTSSQLGPRAVAFDQPERRVAEEQLRILGSVVDNTADGVLILTPAVETSGPRIAFANRSLCRLLGTSREMLLANTVDALRLRDEHGTVHAALLKHFFSEERFVGRGTVKRANGTAVDVDITMLPIRDGGERVSHWIGFLREVAVRTDEAPQGDSTVARRRIRQGQFLAALNLGQFILHYQPIVDLNTGRLSHAEALVRWNHPERGILYPATFLPFLEETGVMRQMALWGIDAALRQHLVWKSQGVNVGLSLNLSPSALHDESISEAIAELIERRGVDPAVIRLEITENAILSDPSKALAVLSLLQTQGVLLSLDDFGTGYSSLTNLRQIPFQEIKIDKSFVTRMADEDGDAAIVRAVIGLAHNLGRRVVAEGVEHLRVLAALRDLGCDYAQGYFLAKPLPADSFADWARLNASATR